MAEKRATWHQLKPREPKPMANRMTAASRRAGERRLEGGGRRPCVRTGRAVQQAGRCAVQASSKPYWE